MQGRQFPDANLPAAAPEERKAIFEIAMKTLAQLQAIDTDKLNLDCIGDKENFFQQRVGTITASYTLSDNRSLESGTLITTYFLMVNFHYLVSDYATGSTFSHDD